MAEAFLVKTLLLIGFFLGGILMILLGFLIWRRLWDCGSVEVDAECIDVHQQTVALGTGSDRTFIPNAKRPVYRYYYEGKHYTASPLLASNRPGYAPVPGACKVRINRKHPEKIYSPERRFAARILIAIGAMWVVIAGVLAVILPV